MDVVVPVGGLLQSGVALARSLLGGMACFGGSTTGNKAVLRDNEVTFSRGGFVLFLSGVKGLLNLKIMAKVPWLAAG